MAMAQIGAKVPPELKDQILAAAATARRTQSDWIRLRLEEALTKSREAAPATEAA